MMPILMLFASFIAMGSTWNQFNNPYSFGQLESRFEVLPLNGELRDKRLGWPGSHWNNNLGGIAHRWNSPDPQNFTYKPLSLQQLKKMTTAELNYLSPAEKFDIFNRRYNYPTVTKIFNTNSPNEPAWNGICHGYAPASLNHPEPAKVTLVNGDGIKLTFYSSDVAALLAYYYAKVISTPRVLIGRRCNYWDGSIPEASQAACGDIHPAAFHLVLTNKLGLEKVGILADIDRFLEVWNNVALKYNTIILGEYEPSSSSAKRTFKRVRVETTVVYTAEIQPKFDPVIGTGNAEYSYIDYEYYLDLDVNGSIIGGEWIGPKRPDFIWTQKKAYFANDWSLMNTIYRPAKRQ